MTYFRGILDNHNHQGIFFVKYIYSKSFNTFQTSFRTLLIPYNVIVMRIILYNKGVSQSEDETWLSDPFIPSNFEISKAMKILHLKYYFSTAMY